MTMCPNPSSIEMHGIVKRFGNLVANDNVELEIRPGEVLGLLGENGAGKTTLMRVLFGIYQPDSGQICINRQPVQIRSPRLAIRLGIGMIHQKLMLVPTMTVAQNVILGAEPVHRGLVDFQKAEQAVAALAQAYGIHLDPKARVGRLSLGEQQCTEILKSLYRQAELLILDEPTTVLTPSQTQDLFATLRGMAETGKKVVIITHKLPEVIAVTDRVVVLRDGKVVGSFNTRETNERELARAMVGRELANIVATPGQWGEPTLRLTRISARSDRGHMAVQDVSLTVHAGEIFGIGGVSGNGQEELVEVIAGLRAAVSGSLSIKGREIDHANPQRMQSLGVSFIPADRYGMGTIGQFSVAENMVLQRHGQLPFARYGLLRHREIQAHAEQLTGSYDIHCQGVRAEARTLSGGNLQKLVLARELSADPCLIVAEYPTRGLDIAATEYVHNVLLKQRAQGAAIVVVCPDLDELLALSDRVGIMYVGQIQGILTRDEYDIDRIGLLMTGSRAAATAGGA